MITLYKSNKPVPNNHFYNQLMASDPLFLFLTTLPSYQHVAIVS